MKATLAIIDEEYLRDGSLYAKIFGNMYWPKNGDVWDPLNPMPVLFCNTLSSLSSLCLTSSEAPGFRCAILIRQARLNRNAFITFVQKLLKDPLLSRRYNRSWWKNTTPKREVELFRQLMQDGKSFTELLKALKWGSQTLTFYLKTLESKGCIASKKHGRNVTYALVRSNPYVAKMLKLLTPSSHDVRIFKRVTLDKLDEEAFIDNWLNSMKFVFLNLLRDYTLLGKQNTKEETKEILRRILQVEIEDLTDINNAYGQVLTRRVQAGTVKPGRIQEIRARMQEEVRNQLLK